MSQNLFAHTSKALPTPSQNEEHKGKTAHSGREMLPEEVKFDKLVYGGISYFAQAATGIVLAYWMKNGSGRPMFDKASKWAGKYITSKITGKAGEAATKEAATLVSVTTMIMVGNTFLLPVKWLENRKSEIVEKMVERDNEKQKAKGNPPTETKLAYQRKLLGELEAEPIQSWWSLGSGRVFGLTAVYATLFALGDARNEAAGKLFTGTVSDGLRAGGFVKAAESQPLSNLLHMVFLDSFYSAISSGGLYVFSHYIRPPVDRHPDHNRTELIADIIEPAHSHSWERGETRVRAAPNANVQHVGKISANMASQVLGAPNLAGTSGLAG